MDFQARHEQVLRFQNAKENGKLKELVAEERRKHETELSDSPRLAAPGSKG